MMAPSCWIGTSFKMTKNRAEALIWANTVRAVLERDPMPQLVPFVLPPATALAEVAAVLRGSPVLVGAQNAHWAPEGAWTGELSVGQLADAGAQLIEIGHAERRAHFGETDAIVAQKVAAVHGHGLIPLVCVGEPARVRAEGDPTAFVLAQAAAALEAATGSAPVWLAYEPVWAIGEHGTVPEPDQVAGVLAALQETFGERVEAVLYGGSVHPGNAAALLQLPGCGGLFVGRAAWPAHGMVDLLAAALTTTRDRPTVPRRGPDR